MNSNVNIADRMFAYIKHGVDVSDDIKNVFSNSLIVIGDEQQIYIPAKNAYVGIGQTAYTNTIERIRQLEESVNDLNDKSFGGVVSKIYTQFTPTEYIAVSGAVNDDDVYLNNELTIKAVGNYDPSTGYARTSYVYQTREGTFSTNYSGLFDQDQRYATSGINITTYYGQIQKVWNDATGQFVQKQIGNYIVIDDAQTWSYMTSSYAYALDYIQKYTDSEVNRMYHNILGDADPIYIPVSFGSVYKVVDEPENHNEIYDVTTNPSGSVIYKSSTSTYYQPQYNVVDTTKTNYYTYNTSNGNYTQVTIAQLMSMMNGAGANTRMYPNSEEGLGTLSCAQLYVLDDQYNSTYNINLRDGINTIKEVAYLLDILTDGQLGETTYITYSAYTGRTDLTTTYSLIVPVNPHPKNDDLYAYYTTINTDNIGIKMAYSIAGNKAEIDNLKKDMDRVESGESTIRSVQNTDTELVNITINGGTLLTDAPGTDPNDNVSGAVYPNSYVTGDINLKINVDYALSYATVNSARIGSSHLNTVAGITFWNEYRAADMSKIHIESVSGSVTYPSYYVLHNGSMELLSSSQVIEDPHQRTSNTQYYWKPEGSAYSATENPVYEYISKKDLANSTESDDKFANTSNILYTYNPSTNRYIAVASGVNFVTSGLDWYNDDVPSGSDGKLYYLKDFNAIEVHAPVPTTNKLATTEWTVAYIKEKLDLFSKTVNGTGNGNSDLDLSEVDTDIRYSDFESLYWNYVKSNYIEGSAAYRTAYSDAYADFIAENPLTYTVNNVDYTLSDYSNTIRYRLNSGKISNITQEDGLVRASVEELPTDTTEVEINIWGAEDSDSKFGYSAIQSVDVDSSLLQTLFKWQHSSSPTEPSNQIFVIDGWTYYKVPTSDSISSGTFFYLENGTYEVYDPANGAITNYSDPSLKSWKQLYRRGPKYVELDLANAQITENTALVSTANELKFNNKYIVVKANDGSLSVSGNAYNAGTGSMSVSASDLSKLYYISSTSAKKVKYLSVENKHFSYDKEGHGENKFIVKANITKLEDASADNTGFADAFDVKTYIHNLFTWVDISASLDEDTLSTRDIFYKYITFTEYDSYVDKPTLYKKENGSYETVSVGNIEVDWFYYDGNDKYTGSNVNGPTVSDTQSAGKSTVNGVYARQEFNVSGASVFTTSCNYLIKLENVNINPNNLVITRYGAPVIANP